VEFSTHGTPAERKSVVAQWLEASIAALLIAVCIVVLLLAGNSSSGQNPIQIENSNAGTTSWQLSNYAGSHEIEGYASAVSVNAGGSISLFVNTAAPNYTLTVYRVGWYGGLGGRQMTAPVTLPGTVQTTPAPDPLTGIVDSG
jgi:hypothetical protein